MNITRAFGMTLAAMACGAVFAQMERFDKLATLPFEEGRPTPRGTGRPGSS